MDNVKKPRKLVGLTFGALTAWFAIFLVFMFNIIGFTSLNEAKNTIQFLFLWHLLLGLPIAFIVCFTFGSLAWYVCEALHLIKMRHAVLGGGLAGAILSGLVYLAESGTTAPAGIGFLSVPIILGTIVGGVTHHSGYKNYDT